MNYDVDCLCDKLGITTTHFSPPEVRELPGGYCVSSRFVDEIESLHLLHVNGYTDDYPRQARKVGRLSLYHEQKVYSGKHARSSLPEKSTVFLSSLLLQRNKEKRDSYLRKSICKGINLDRAKAFLQKALPSELQKTTTQAKFLRTKAIKPSWTLNYRQSSGAGPTNAGRSAWHLNYSSDTSKNETTRH